MGKFICVAKCPELDKENLEHCVDTTEGIEEREERYGDYCRCGNIPKWEEYRKVNQVLTERSDKYE